jgi:hypothetical protein
MSSNRARGLDLSLDRFSSWMRFVVIFAVIVVNGMFEESLILRAELMMLLRKTRDVLRYDVRWTVQEKFRLFRARRTGR